MVHNGGLIFKPHSNNKMNDFFKGGNKLRYILILTREEVNDKI